METELVGCSDGAIIFVDLTKIFCLDILNKYHLK